MTRAPIATTEPADEAAAQSADALFDAVYARLKAMAGRQLARGSAQASLDTTALVHELYLRVTTNRDISRQYIVMTGSEKTPHDQGSTRSRCRRAASVYRLRP